VSSVDLPPDTLFGGTMVLYQPARGRGYRVNVDAVLLAWFAGSGRRARRAVDLGAGVGAVGLSLLHRDRAQDVLFVERDPELSLLATRNLEANGWTTRGRAISLDVANLRALPPGSADLVVCNPPYQPPGHGRPPAVGASARVGALSAFTRAARRMIAPRGRVAFVYPASDLVTLVAEIRESGLEPKRACFVHAKRGSAARVVLLLASPAKRGGLVVDAPVIERDERGPTETLTGLLAP